MSRRTAVRTELYRSEQSTHWQSAPGRESGVKVHAARGGLSVPIVAAVVMGLLIGAAIAVFENGPADLRLQVYDLIGIGAPRSCEEASALGIGPQRRGEQYYFQHLDIDSDGISCAYTANGFR
jgi:hypothetical protein